jgi:hypothetical protein
MMRALTLWQPWAWAIAAGHKRIENRPWTPWPSVIGQRIAIHAGRTYDDAGARAIAEDFEIEVPSRSLVVSSGIVAVATVLGSVRLIDELPPSHADQADWLSGPFGWLLDNVRAIEPVTCRGALGLWMLPADVEAEVRRRAKLAVSCPRQSPPVAP